MRELSIGPAHGWSAIRVGDANSGAARIPLAPTDSLGATRSFGNSKANVLQPEDPEREALGVTARAEIPRLAGEGEQVLMGAVAAPDPREPVVQDAAGEELVGHLAHDGAPRAVGLREPLVIDRLQRVEAAPTAQAEGQASWGRSTRSLSSRYCGSCQNTAPARP